MAGGCGAGSGVGISRGRVNCSRIQPILNHIAIDRFLPSYHHVSLPITSTHPSHQSRALGQEFDDFKSFKIAMQDWTLSDPPPPQIYFPLQKFGQNTQYRMPFQGQCDIILW